MRWHPSRRPDVTRPSICGSAPGDVGTMAAPTARGRQCTRWGATVATGSDIVKQGRTPSIMPFDMSGIERSADGVLRYTGLDESLLELLRRRVARTPDRECIV